MNIINMIRNNDTLQMNDFINNKSTNYLKKGKKKSKRTTTRKTNNNIPNLNFFFMNGKPHIADNTHLNIPTLNEIQNVGRNIQNNINDRLNQILQNPVRNNDQLLNELRNIRGVQNDITNRILPNIGNAIERGNALNEAGLVINSSNPIGVNPAGVNLRRSQQEQVIPVMDNLRQYGPLNPYLEQLAERARQLPNQYGSPEPSNVAPSQPPLPSAEAGMNFRAGDMNPINRANKPNNDDDDSSDDEGFFTANTTPQTAGMNIDFSSRTPQSAGARPLLISASPNQNRVNIPSFGFGGSASTDIIRPATGRGSLDIDVIDEEGKVLSPRGIFED